MVRRGAPGSACNDTLKRETVESRTVWDNQPTPQAKAEGENSMLVKLQAHETV